jgi:hypothetical protein
MSAALPHLRRLLQVVAEYTRLSAVQTAGRADHRQASRPQYPGLRIGQTRPGDQAGGAGTIDGSQEQLGGDRLDPVASHFRVSFDR